MPRIYAENEEHACAQGYVDFVAVVRVNAGGTVDALASGNLTKKA